MLLLTAANEIGYGQPILRTLFSRLAQSTDRTVADGGNSGFSVWIANLQRVIGSADDSGRQMVEAIIFG